MDVEGVIFICFHYFVFNIDFHDFHTEVLFSQCLCRFCFGVCFVRGRAGICMLCCCLVQCVDFTGFQTNSQFSSLVSMHYCHDT